MKTFSTRQPRLLILCVSLLVSYASFSAIASSFQHVAADQLCVAQSHRVASNTAGVTTDPVAVTAASAATRVKL